ncbi:uncharacterized protein C6orf136 homolog [Chelonus insularis]|uniref:uncharacterized protein C6orf136 homolog n=1 Tax=Chelonus insularis TaxID=460826 RepID=UPI00158B947E|nr:uncharacterized protein C6orf136 homolog [Chelonus insularis]
MSFYIRNIPNKLCLYVGTRNQIIQSDRKLTKLMRISAFTHKATSSSSKTIENEFVKLHTPINTIQETNLNNLNSSYYSIASKLAEQTNPITESEKLNRPASNEDNSSEKKTDGPTKEQLEFIYRTLEHDLPKFFVTAHNYNIYSPHLEFVNNFKGEVSHGLPAYIKQTLWIKIAGHLCYVYVKFEVLKITKHPEDNTVRVRWRICGLSTWQALSNFYRMMRNLDRKETWYDGFSTFFVGSDGKVFKHIADKMMPDNDPVQDKEKTNIAAKLTT